MARKPKPISARHDTVLSLKVTAPTRRGLERLAGKAGLKVSAYSARVLEDHVARPKPLTAVAEDLKAAKDRLFYGSLSADLFPKGVVDRIDAASGEQVLALAAGLVDEVKSCVSEARAAVLGAIDKFDRLAFWHERTSGLPQVGTRFAAFEAAWIADNRTLAADIAEDARDQLAES